MSRLRTLSQKFSFTPGFSPVDSARRNCKKPFPRFRTRKLALFPRDTSVGSQKKSKPLKRFCCFFFAGRDRAEARSELEGTRDF